MAIDPYTTTKPFKIQDEETGQEVIVDMKIIDIIQYKLQKELITTIRRVRING